MCGRTQQIPTMQVAIAIHRDNYRHAKNERVNVSGNDTIIASYSNEHGFSRFCVKSPPSPAGAAPTMCARLGKLPVNRQREAMPAM